MFCKICILPANTIALYLHQQVKIPQLVNGIEMHLYTYFIITVLRTALEWLHEMLCVGFIVDQHPLRL